MIWRGSGVRNFFAEARNVSKCYDVAKKEKVQLFQRNRKATAILKKRWGLRKKKREPALGN